MAWREREGKENMAFCQNFKLLSALWSRNLVVSLVWQPPTHQPANTHFCGTLKNGAGVAVVVALKPKGKVEKWKCGKV